MKVLAIFDEKDCLPVTWERDGNEYIITYGTHVERHTCDLEAGREFGECVRHSLECAGKLYTEG